MPGTGNGAGAGSRDPQAFFVAIAWLEAVAEPSLKTDPQIHNRTKR